MRVHPPRSALALILAASFLSCSENPIRPRPEAPPPAARATLTGTRPQVVISQIYGGGGNGGATLNRDYIELYNSGTSVADVSGWKLLYASATGTSWSNTTLLPSNSLIQPGHYFLVPEASNNTAVGAPLIPGDIPAPGTINLAGASGKIALTSANVTFGAVACPTDPSLVDLVSFGSATDCGSKSTPVLSASLAAFRVDDGCAWTGDLSRDFVAAAPAPRNSASPVKVCPGVVPVGPLDHVAMAPTATVVEGSTIKLTATPQDANNQTVSTATVTWSSSDETIATVDANGTVTGVAASATPVTITATATDGAIQKNAGTAVTVNAPGINWLDVSSSSTSFPAGFQTQLFVTARVSSGGMIVPANFAFSPADPAIATIATVQNTGLITGVAGSTTRPGFTITAVPSAGGTPYVFTTRSITIETPVHADPSIYATNDEFGDPTAASAGNPNDMLIVRPEYTLSYNQSRGTPNWVAYELDSRQMGGQDRCNCFTADPSLPPEKQIFTSDYTNGGFDRGHMARSFDRTATNYENATTFYLTNIVPQTADLNQGVWAQFENALGDSAQAGRAVYIVTGPLYGPSPATLKGEGKVAIPDYTWKVALIGPRAGGLPFTRTSIQSWADLDGVTVLAVKMPNISGVRTDPWSKYLVTVDALESATGLDFLSLLPTAFQDAVEAGDHAPVPRFSVTGTADEGSALTFDASTSTDPDLGRTDLGRTEGLTYTWHFSDGTQLSGVSVTKAFADNGSYTATLTVADAFGWEESAAQPVSVANVAPVVTLAATSPLSILSGDPIAVQGSFTDPGADAPWSALINWGNGATTPFGSVKPGVAITGASALLAAGAYTVTLTVTDKDGGSGSASVAVTVDRRAVTGRAYPGSIDLAETEGDIKVGLSAAPLADVSTLNLASVLVGSADIAPRKVKVKADSKVGGEISLRFARQDLLSAGLLTPSTTELILTGTLANGVQIVSHVPVNVH